MKFKVGDVVMVNEFLGRDSFLFPQMKKYVGWIGIVKTAEMSLTRRAYFYTIWGSWPFLESELTLLDRP